MSEATVHCLAEVSLNRWNIYECVCRAAQSSGEHAVVARLQGEQSQELGLTGKLRALGLGLTHCVTLWA